MKTIILIIALAVAGWYAMNRLHKTEAVKQVENSAQQYAKGLRTDVKRAEAAGEKANAAIKKAAGEVKSAVEYAVPK